MTNTIIQIAHHLTDINTTKDDIVVDATMGHGHDTLFMAKRANHVYAFDIQEEALDDTHALLQENGLGNVTLICDSHEQITKYVKSFKGIVFNLGYLPGHDKTIRTKKESTIKALETVFPALEPHGFILVVSYPGHPGGDDEHDAVRTFFAGLDDTRYEVIEVALPFQKNLPPSILFAKKRKG